MIKDYFKILNANENMTLEEVKKLYHQLALKYHPDRCQDIRMKPKMEEEFKKINLAMEEIRHYYDNLKHQDSKNGNKEEELRKQVAERKRNKKFLPLSISTILLLSGLSQLGHELFNEVRLKFPITNSVLKNNQNFEKIKPFENSKNIEFIKNNSVESTNNDTSTKASEADYILEEAKEFLFNNKEYVEVIKIIEEKKIISDYDYDSIKEISENLFIISKNNKFGAININGDVILSFDYDTIQYFADGILKIEKNGSFEFFFPETKDTKSTNIITNPDNIERITYHGLLKDGLYIQYNLDGVVLKKGNFKNDTQEGLWEYTTTPKTIANFSDGKLDGLFQSFHDNGILMSEGNYLNDAKNGIWKTYNEKGILIDEQIFN